MAPGEERVGGNRAAAYEAFAASNAVAPEPPPRPRTRTLTDSPAPHGRLLLVAGGTTAAAVAAVGLLLGGAAFRPVAAPLGASPTGSPSPASLRASPESPLTNSSPPSPKPAHRRPAHLAVHVTHAPPGAIEALTRMRRTVDEGLAASEVRADVAVDLDSLISGLQAELAAGEHVDVDMRVSELRTEIAQRVRDGGLARTRADVLTKTLSAV